MKRDILLSAFLIASLCSAAQNPIVGLWEGKINAGMDLRIIFNLTQDENGNYSATMDLPDQGIKGIVSKDVVIKNDSLFIAIQDFKGNYKGKRTSDSVISGYWTQGISTALRLKKIEKISTIQRPQTPVPPYSYKSEDVIYTNTLKSMQYGATITTPYGDGPFPAVVLITGSGQQNRDEEISGHKPFAVIADYLTRNGFVVLRVDDRGVGQTTGSVMSATTLDFCDDVNTGLDYLTSRKEVDNQRLGLIGHSEGGMIAPILASKRKDIAAIVLLAAPGKSTPEILLEQNELFLTAIGLPKEYVTSYIDLYSSIIHVMQNMQQKETAKTAVTEQVETWLKKTPGNIAMATTGIVNDESKNKYVNAMLGTLGSSWFQFFLSYESREFLEKLSCKVFALNGSKDIQIVSKSNLPGIEAALKRSKSKGYLIKEYEGLNHLFQKCNACTIKEYGALEETISVDVLKDISAWLSVNL